MSTMKTYVYSVYDDKMKAYLQPFFQSTDAAAIRAVRTCVADSSHLFCMHAADYSLFRIGSFDENTGVIEGETIANLGNLLQWKMVEGE